jgi:hypothetical protein
MDEMDSYRQLKDQIRRWRQPVPSMRGRVWRRASLDTVPLRIRVGILCCTLLVTSFALLVSITSVGIRRESPSTASVPVILPYPNHVITEERTEHSAGIAMDVWPSSVVMNNVVHTTDRAGIAIGTTASSVVMNNMVYHKER